jgi:hypothetical protein
MGGGKVIFFPENTAPLKKLVNIINIASRKAPRQQVKQKTHSQWGCQASKKLERREEEEKERHRARSPQSRGAERECVVSSSPSYLALMLGS